MTHLPLPASHYEHLELLSWQSFYDSLNLIQKVFIDAALKFNALKLPIVGIIHEKIFSPYYRNHENHDKFFAVNRIDSNLSQCICLH